MNNDYVLEVSQLHKSYKSKKVVNNLSFKVKKGDIFGFLGRNGAGKTTTIKMILSLLHSDKGSVKINGYDTKNDFKKAISQVGAVVEIPKFYSYLSGYDNLKLIANLHPHLSKKRIDEVIEIVGLNKRSRDKVKTYSLGMKQRLGIARALLSNPSLVILDEPTNGLDPQGIKEIREMICQLALEQDITFLISTHLLYEVEQICNKVVILNEGEIIASGLVNDLLNEKHEIIEICTNNKQQLINTLKEVDYIIDQEDTPTGLKITISKGKSAVLNRLLNSKNILVNYLIPKSQSLEEYFISITKGGDQIA